ncbi:SymE family type I addiction module toxin [Apirhabdus apintestini]|nr:SymE family type I addiction module toxin [Enterobacteriaceae bacterium CA-0114]
MPADLHLKSAATPLNLKGNWLEEAGFASNTPVTVTVDTGNW